MTGAAAPTAAPIQTTPCPGGGGPAVVVFTDAAELWWLRLLAPGFRHCFVVVRRSGAWVVIDPLAHYTRVDLAPPWRVRSAEDIAEVYRSRGLIAAITEVREPPRALAPIRPFTCVEAVKRILGLRAPAVLTPWQLFRMLEGEETKFLSKENNLDMASGVM